MKNEQGQQDIYNLYSSFVFIFFSIFRNIFILAIYCPWFFIEKLFWFHFFVLFSSCFYCQQWIWKIIIFLKTVAVPFFIFKIPYNLLRNFFFKNLRTSSKIFKSCFCTYKTDFADHPSTLPKAYVINGFTSVLLFVLNNFEYL